MFTKAILLAGITLAATTANASGFPTTDDVTAGVSAGYTFSGDTGNPAASDDLDDYANISASVRNYLTGRISLGAFASYGHTKTRNLGGKVNAVGFGAGARFHLDDFAYAGIRPVIGTGVVFTRFDSGDLDETKTEKAIYFEGAAEWGFSDRWVAEAGIRGSLETRDAFFDTQIFAGVSVTLGSHQQ